MESLVRWSEVQTLTYASPLESDAEFVGETAKRYLALAAGMYRFVHTAADPSQLFALKFGGVGREGVVPLVEVDRHTATNTSSSVGSGARVVSQGVNFHTGNRQLPLSGGQVSSGESINFSFTNGRKSGMSSAEVVSVDSGEYL